MCLDQVGEILFICHLNLHRCATASPFHGGFLIFGFISMGGSVLAWLLAVLSAVHDETFLADQAVCRSDKKSIMSTAASQGRRVIWSRKAGFAPYCLGMWGIYCFYLPNTGWLGGWLSQNKKNGWNSSLPMEENGLNFISYNSASLTRGLTPACRFWTFLNESPPFHSCFELWHEAV